MKIMVVPTVRKDSITKFLKKWEDCEDWDEIIVVEDNPEKDFDLGLKYHYCWRDIEEDLKEDHWIISRRDSAIRCYGFLKAYEMGAKYIFTLDDDCLPLGMDLCSKHVENMENTPRWTTSVGEHTRGMPYENLGKLDNVMFNVGLWEGTPDIDSVQSLALPTPMNYRPPETTRIIPHSQYFPFCGMNFAFKREAIPLCYFPLMGENSPHGRFDDIWFGVIAKKICDHMGWHISCGEPFVYHARASNPFDNLVKESSGIRMNEKFWEIIDSMQLSNHSDVFGCIRNLSRELKTRFDEYLQKLGRAIDVWLRLILQRF